MHLTGNKSTSGWTVATVLVSVCLIIPICVLMLSIFTAPTDSVRHIWEHKILDSVVNTVGLCLSVSAATLLLGSTTAWLITRYHLRFARVMGVLLILPLAIPSYIHAYSLSSFLTAPPFLTAWYTLTFSLTPYVFIISRFAFQRESRVLFDAAQVQGARYPFFTLALPMARPALIGATALVSMEVLNEYGTFVYLGVETLTTTVFKLWFNYYDVRGAAQLSSYLLIGVLLFAFMERWSRRRIDYTQSYTDIHSHTRCRVKRRGVVALIYVYCAVPIVCGVGVPSASLVYWAIRDGRHLFVQPRLWISAAHTIGIAAAASLLCVAAGLVLAYGSRVVRRRWVTGLVGWTTFGYAVPGAIIAMGVLRVAGELAAVAGLGLLLFAYTVRYIAVCYHPLAGGLAQQCACVDEVAQSLGASHWRRLFHVVLPRLRTPMSAVAVLIIFDIIKDLPLTIILRPIGLETLALQSFYYASEEQFGLAAPFAVVMCAIGVVVVVATQWRQWKTPY